MLFLDHIFYLALTLTSATVLAAVNGPCSFGKTGVCLPTAQCSGAGDIISVGFCPNDPNDVKCCSKPSCGLGGYCEWTYACDGITETGLCPGPADFKCCLPIFTTRSGAHSISANGVKFIAGFEGFRKDFYLDAAGVKTIGYGHACQPSSACNSINPPITEAEGLVLLKSDVARFVSCVDSDVNVPLTQNQLDALASFAFNLGCAPIHKIANFINDGKFKAATDNILEYVYSGGVKQPGLERRRKAEVALFYTD